MADLTGQLPTVGQNPWNLNNAITLVNNDVETRLLSSTAPELIRDTIGNALVAGTNVTINVDDANDQITISSAGLNVEAVQDTVAAFLVAGANITIDYDDVANTLTISATGGGGVSDWGDIGGTLSDQTDLQTALNAKAALASPTFTGNPTAPTQAATDDSTRIATTAHVKDYLQELGFPTLPFAQYLAGEWQSRPDTVLPVFWMSTLDDSGSTPAPTGRIAGDVWIQHPANLGG